MGKMEQNRIKARSLRRQGLKLKEIADQMDLCLGYVQILCSGEVCSVDHSKKTPEAKKNHSKAMRRYYHNLKASGLKHKTKPHTIKRINTMLELRGRGWSMQRIGKNLGLTKNQVIGALWRYERRTGDTK